MSARSEAGRLMSSVGRCIVCIAICLAGYRSAQARENLVTKWNAAFLRAIQNESTHPCLASRNLAILHIAIHDSISAVTRSYRPYCFKNGVTENVSIEAAANEAAYQVAVQFFPSRKSEFDSLLTNCLATLTNSPAIERGIELGRESANTILMLRRNDGASTTVPYIPSNKPGHWRRTPPFFRPPECPQWQFLKPFAMTNVIAFRPPGPPKLASPRYAADVAESRRLGGKESKNRTPDETQVAQFWSDFSYTVTPPGHWNEVARSIAIKKDLSLEESARLFALLNIALADAGIVAWDAKYKYDFWRPVTAIERANEDDNSKTTPDSSWQSFLPSPAFPEYPSGHSTFSGAAAEILADYFGTDEMEFNVTCDVLPGVVRKFHSFSKAAEEVGRSRIYGGIHFSSADVDGRKAGKRFAKYVFGHFLLSCHGVFAKQPSP